ncbi:hypothetical protein O1611_g1574 [Lasiodiplodia mahajangana]|uniref:Uncharacterized protein n=1 Tax=Lasiodiplodia mahajangana TaxID=1108764 RepID=A0ACC2JXW9_9PEZI|nr:hypothetical protein O1611_g1574 [Lasiodiplodia mahajangana]
MPCIPTFAEVGNLSQRSSPASVGTNPTNTFISISTTVDSKLRPTQLRTELPACLLIYTTLYILDPTTNDHIRPRPIAQEIVPVRADQPICPAIPPQPRSREDSRQDDDQIEDVKKRVEEKEGILPAQQRLIYAGKQISEGFANTGLAPLHRHDDVKLGEGGVVPDATLHLVLTLRGGASASQDC